MSKYGFEAGANWTTTPDSPHFQVKGSFTNVFDAKHTTPWVTGAIQQALNNKINAGLKIDKSWGAKTTDAVNKFRKTLHYKTALGQIGAEAFKALLT
jgi:peptidoglycan L-alanyl-D-glutamate endopeptidase CwlK